MNTNYITRDEIIQKIAASKHYLGLIGTTAFDFPLDNDDIVPGYEKSLRKILSDKFHADKSDYRVTIIRESNPQIDQFIQYQYSLKTIGMKDFEYYSKINTSYGFVEKRNDVPFYGGFRGYLRAQKNQNIEPTENVCRKILDETFDNARIDGVFKELVERDYKDADITGEILKLLILMWERAAENKIKTMPEYKVLAKRSNWNAEENEKFSECFKTWFNALLADKLKPFTCTEDLRNLSESYKQITFKGNFIYKSIKFEVIFAFEKKEDDVRAALVDACLEYLARVEETDYEALRHIISSQAFQKRERDLRQYKTQNQYKQRFVLKTLFDFIENQMIRIDNEYYCVYPYEHNKFIFVGEDDGVDTNNVLLIYKKQFERYCSSNNATEVTDKGDRGEYVNAYVQVEPNSKDELPAQNRMRVGLRARESFNYKKPQSMQFAKNVAWALVFDHNGNLLLHRRGMNAKDNQGMWDKSVGGHIAYNDPDAIYGARREILEELYETEGMEQSHIDKKDDNKEQLVTKDPEKIRFFGQWKPGFYPKLNKGIQLESDEFYCFKYDFDQIRNVIVSERKLPSGDLVHNKCFVDLFFVVTSDAFDVSTLKNSKYLLLPPGIIRDFYNSKKIPAEYSPTGVLSRFEVTPDLSFMIENETFWGTVRQFSDEVCEAFSIKRNN